MQLISLKQTSPGRITASLSNGTEVRTTTAVIADLRLYPECALTEEKLEEFLLLSRQALARERAASLLSLRPMSRKELKDKLLQKGEDPETAEYCTAWLEERGLLDDENYAQAVVRHYAAKGYGAGRIRSELARRGIARDFQDTALDSRPDSSDSIDHFLSRRLTDPEDRDQIRKLTAALYRRGFSREEIRSALERFSAQYEDE